MTSQLTFRQRLVPVVALLLLAPWAAECSWGGFAAGDFVLVMVIMAPLYGAAAVLIRETARRTGRGWPTIVLLAAAFGLLQAGLIDQSLLNPAYLDDTQFAAVDVESRATVVPGIGISAAQALDYVGNHIALSVCAPIVIVESFLPEPARRRPWLHRPGLVATGVLFAGGAALIYADTAGGDAYTPSAVQVLVVAGLVLAAAALGMLPRWRRSPARTGRPAVRARWVGLVVLAAHLTSALPPGWLSLGVRVLAATAVATVIVVWSRRSGWGQAHVLATAAPGLITAALTAYLVPTYTPVSGTAALAGDVAVSVVTATLIAAALWRLTVNERRAREALPAPGC